MSKDENKRGFKLEVPLNASEIEGFKPEQALKVAVQKRDGSMMVETVKLSGKGVGTATFTFKEQPGSMRVIVGPETATDDELKGMQTITRDISARLWLDKDKLKIGPVLISPYYWYWWLRWCRTFTVRGRVICPDGNPVPGAEVCASDVDHWWWWSSRQQVGCATTDANGAFEIKFRWCCGWWPWWWWRQRVWQLEPLLADRIMPVLQRELKLQRLPAPTPKPSPAVFTQLMKPEETLTRQPKTTINPAALDGLRGKLLDRLPFTPELGRLKLWPWHPWHPWWDCTPDIIFKVTQNCHGSENVIVDESYADTRWNIPQTLNVTLVANEEACCIPGCDDDQCPEGDCLLITHACDDPIYTIGGNPGAAATPAGYRNPGVVATYGDRPYAGVVPISGQFGNLTNVDYYEFEWSDDGGASWNAMPVAAAGGFNRVYWGPKVGPGPGGPLGFHSEPFNFTTIDGRHVIESREHFEANNNPGTWGGPRYWLGNTNLLMRWLTKNNFADDTYMLRVKSWNRVGDNLINGRILPLCNTQDDNGITLTIDNRVTGAGSGHPTAPDHPCDGDTVHTCTTEPDTDIIDVRLVRNGVPLPAIGACGETAVQDGDVLRVDFMAHDPDGHLAYYQLRAHYGESEVVNLLTLGGTLTPLPGAVVPPAAQVGPNYGAAQAQAAPATISPTWAGGALRLEVDANAAFEKSCCYLLRLRAFKRTIANCNDNYPHRNRSEYSFMVSV